MNKHSTILPYFVSAGLVMVISGAVIWYRQENKADYGSKYPSKQALCSDLAQSYLKTVTVAEDRELAIVVETDLYNLCMLDLNQDALRRFRLSAINNFLDRAEPMD